MQLLQHNEATLQQVRGFLSRGENCCIVNPCGSGKTSVITALLYENSTQRFLLITKQKNAAEYYRQRDPAFQRVKIVTYNKMLFDVKNGNLSGYDADVYLVDEAHYVDAETWGPAFRELTQKFSPVVIGITATPRRYSQRGTKDTVVEKYFDGNNAGNYTSEDLMKSGVFTQPEYVLSLYDGGEVCEKNIARVLDSDLDDEKKEKLITSLNVLKDKWETEDSPRMSIRRYLPKFMYKNRCNRVLVYMSSVQEIQEKQDEIAGYISETFPGKTVLFYSYTYKDKDDSFNRFLEEDDSYIKVLFSIDRVMETVHIDDLRVLIMMRHSVSNRIITQQFGRVNSIGNKDKPLIIDMVNNLSRLIGARRPISRSDNMEGEPHKGQKSPFTLEGVNVLRKVGTYQDVFQKVDNAMKSTVWFPYRGVTGTLRDICDVFHLEQKAVMEFAKTTDIQTALDFYFEKMKAEKKGKLLKPRKDTLDDLPFEYEPFTLTPEQKQWAENHLYMVARFIKNREIEDEDIQQELNILFLQRIAKRYKDGLSDARWSISIAVALRGAYVRECRRKFLHGELFENTHLSVWHTEEQSSPLYNAEASESRERIEEVLLTLTEREAEVLKYRFYDQMTLDEVAPKYGVHRERIRQIENKAIRKMRYPHRANRLYKDPYDLQ